MRKLYKDNYFIYANGGIFSIRLNRFVGWKSHNGYQRMRIGRKMEFAHVLVYEHFGTLPEDYSREKYRIHHINGNKLDNNINNLQCMLVADHSSLHNKGEKHPMYGRTGEKCPAYGRTGEKHPMSKITDNQRFALIIKIIQKNKAGKSISQAARELAEEYPLKPEGIRRIWKIFKKRGKKIFWKGGWIKYDKQIY